MALLSISLAEDLCQGYLWASVTQQQRLAASMPLLRLFEWVLIQLLSFSLLQKFKCDSDGVRSEPRRGEGKVNMAVGKDGGLEGFCRAKWMLHFIPNKSSPSVCFNWQDKRYAVQSSIESNPSKPINFNGFRKV